MRGDIYEPVIYEVKVVLNLILEFIIPVSQEISTVVPTQEAVFFIDKKESFIQLFFDPCNVIESASFIRKRLFNNIVNKYDILFIDNMRR